MGCDKWCFFCCGQNRNRDISFFCWLAGGYLHDKGEDTVICLPPCIYWNKIGSSEGCCVCCIVRCKDHNGVEYHTPFGSYTSTGNPK